MQIFNIFLSKQDNQIWVHFETIAFIVNAEERKKRDRTLWLPTILALMSNEYAGNDREKIEKRLLRSSSGTYSPIKIIHKNQICDFMITSSQYRLPYQRQTALDFLATIQTYLENMDFNYVLISDASIQTKNKEPILSLEEYTKDAFSITENSIPALIAQKILDLKCQNKLYASALTAIQTAYAVCFYSNKDDFQENLAVKKRFYMLNILDEELSQLKTETDLIEKTFFALKKLYQFNKEEFFHLAGNLELDAKKSLFRPCIGKIAKDGGKYSWNYTEWDFIKHAIFTLVNDRIHIFPKQQKRGYQDTYSSGSCNHNIFQAEMEHLAKLINLEFEPNCDFHQEIIFTAECSKRLILQGFHLSLNVNEIANANDRFSFFSEQENPVYQKRLFLLMQKMTALITENELVKVENALDSNNNSDSLKAAKQLSLVG